MMPVSLSGRKPVKPLELIHVLRTCLLVGRQCVTCALSMLLVHCHIGMPAHQQWLVLAITPDRNACWPSMPSTAVLPCPEWLKGTRAACTCRTQRNALHLSRARSLTSLKITKPFFTCRLNLSESKRLQLHNSSIVIEKLHNCRTAKH